MMRMFILFFSFLSMLIVHAQKFEASWISPDTSLSTTPNTWYCYRKSFNLPTVPNEVRVKIAVDTKYWLYINNKLVVYEGGLKRGPNPKDTYFDEVDVAPYLQEGKNAIALLVWFWGGAGFSHHNSGRTGLYFESATNGFDLKSDSSWKAIRYEAYQPSTAPKPNFRLSEPNILYDGRKEIKNWYAVSFNDASWPSAKVLGRVPMHPWNRLVKRNIPLFRFGRLQSYQKTQRRGDTLVCYLPYDGQFSPYLKVKAKKGKRIFIASDTYYLGAYVGDTLYTLCSEYLTKRGVQKYESLGWLSGHQIKYVLPKGVKLLSAQYRESGYNASFAGSFECDDTLLNKLWKKAQRTLYVNMRDIYMDCPDRERAQWAGDASTEMEQAFYSLDRSSDDLSRKIFLDLAHWQKPDSVIYNPVPETGWKKELPVHSLMPLSDLWKYYAYTKDLETLQRVYPAFKKYLALWKLQPSGQLVYREGGWNWGDWGENKDFVLIQQGWYLLATQTAAKLALLLHEKEDYLFFQSKIDSVKIYLNSTECWNGVAYRHKDYKGATDDRANALMVLAGVADSSKWEHITDVFLKEEHASPWMEKFVLESLIWMGRPDVALTRMKKRYREMVESGLSTLWEIWEHKEGEVHGNSGYNHGWAGGPLVLLSQYYAGLAPDEEKEDAYIIKPQLGGLKWINASMPTAKGLLRIGITTQVGSMSLSCVVPKGITSKLGIPKASAKFQQLTMNGKSMSVENEDEQYVWVELDEGAYNFKGIW